MGKDVRTKTFAMMFRERCVIMRDAFDRRDVEGFATALKDVERLMREHAEGCGCSQCRETLKIMNEV